MKRNLPHIILKEISTPKDFQGKGGGSPSRPSMVQNRHAHAQSLLTAIDAIEINKDASATYIEVTGRPGEPFLPEKLNVSGLSLLSVNEGETGNKIQSRAVIKASVEKKGIGRLRNKIKDFAEKDRDPNKHGEIYPYNADLANSIETIAQAGLRELWQHPTKSFPEGSAKLLPWEVWLEPNQVDAFKAMASEQGMEIYPDCLTFPEDTVVLVAGDVKQLAMTTNATGAVRRVYPPGISKSFFDDPDFNLQSEHVEELLSRIEYQGTDAQRSSYVTLLDTGVSLAPKPIQQVLDTADRHAASSMWGVDDNHGHGTRMAGLAIFGDLRPILNGSPPSQVAHRLESSKVFPDAGENPHHLLGDITQKAVDAVENLTPDRVRTFVLANTTKEDTPHSGAPTSWSTELDQLAAGVSGEMKQQRLIVISAGNIDPQHGGVDDYLGKCDDDNNAEIESPAQAWNTITVGAMTEMDGTDGPTFGKTLAEVGDLAPMSRTASWKKVWPIKPDVVLEGGNWYNDGTLTPSSHDDLMLITTSREAPLRLFTHMSDTSAATALAARELAILRSEYPTLWPETIRALYVASARWTEQMLSHIPPKKRHQKSALDILFQRYGFGCPDLDRALKSAASAVTLITQDEIEPYEKHKLHQMKLFEFPWPTDVLRDLGNRDVTLRVALSTFIEPNPSASARGRKDRYASHGLRFDLKRADENINQFVRRVGHIATEDRDDDQIDSSSDSIDWQFGHNRRSVGSLHIDSLKIPASDLARRNALAVYPVGGWWKENKNIPSGRKARFALLMEIDADEADVDLYAEVQQAISTKIPIQT